jgi:hypothetical protein
MKSADQFHDLFSSMTTLAVYPPNERTAKYHCNIATPEGAACREGDIYALLFTNGQGEQVEAFLCTSHFELLMLPHLPKEMKEQQSC